MIRRLIATTHEFVATHRTFRHAGVYALLLVAIQELIIRWPIDRMFIDVLIDNLWLLWMDDWTWTAACATSLSLAVLGLVRRSWIDRIAGAIALWPAQLNLGWWLYSADGGLFGALARGLLHITIEQPLNLALELGSHRPSGAILFAAIYFFAIWLVLRIAFALTRDRINEFAARRFQRWNLHHPVGRSATHA